VLKNKTLIIKYCVFDELFISLNIIFSFMKGSLAKNFVII